MERGPDHEFSVRLRDLLARADGAMAADRHRLRARLRGLERSGRHQPGLLDHLAREIEDSVKRREQRETRLPKPTLNPALPVTARADEIAEAIRAHQVVVVCGETGSGKTTQLPQICLRIGRGAAGMIGHTQPRRLAARTVAERIAEELDTPFGPNGLVGYKVRFGDETSGSTLVKLMTDGILLSETQSDRDLAAYDTIIIDEAHERSLNIDFLLGYLRQLLPRRPDLKVIVTSATIDPKRFSEHFGGPSRCPVIEVSGRTYPVEIRYRPMEERERDDFEQNEEFAILDAVDELARLPKGDVLVFLPGEREIRNTAEALRKHAHAGIEILPLFARLSAQDQMKVFHPSGSARRVVLATNVAETSLTVPGIRYVVDTGLARISRYSPRSKVQRLPIEAISQASANQRSGRCGRVAEGVAIRLYSEEDFRARAAFTDPEILRTSLAAVILRMKSLHLGAVESFPFIEPPDSRSIKDGYETLFELGAIDQPDGTGELTEVGRGLARLPVDPKVGRMILAADREGAMEEVLPIAAALSIQDPRDRPMEKQEAADQAQQEFRHPESDFLTLLNIWRRFRENGERLSHSKVRAWCRDSFLSYTRMREWLETFHQLREIAGDLGLRFNGTPASDDAVHRALLTGLIGNIASRNEADGGFDYLAPRGNKVQIFPGSVLFKKGPKWIVAGEVVQTTRTYARTLAKIKPEWIEELAPHLIKRSFSDIHWQRESGQVCAFERVTVLGMTIVPRRRVHYGPMNPAHARELFIHHALVEGEISTEGSFAVHNRQVMEKARSIEARLRRQDVLSENTARFAFFDARVPAEVYSAGAFEQWRKEAERKNPRVLCMGLEHVLRPDLVQEAGGDRFPDSVDLGSAGAPCRATLEYVMDPGSERDGIIATVPLESLAQLEPARCEWLVPGMVFEKVHHLLRTLPKAQRQALGGGSSNQVTGPLRTLAEELAQVMTFGQGTLTGAMSEAIRVLKGVDVPREAWNVSGVPGYLMLTLRVVDQHGKELAAGRDIEEIQGRLAGRARRALEGLARKEFAREGITSWDFDPLPETFETQRGGTKVVGYPALADAGESVSLTLATSREEAEATTRRGLVRLFVLAAKDELVYRIRLLPDDMFKHYAALGPAAELRGDLMDLIAEQAFLAGQPAIRSRQDFETRQTQCWGKMGSVAMEVGNLAASVLALRQQIAGRMGAGVPRTWAASVADIREHSAFLMPPRFLKHVEIARLKQYPRYLEAVRRRLEKLREGGAAKEARGLTEIAGPWKRWTAWVAQTHGKALKLQQESGEPSDAPTSGTGKTGLLPAQRGKRGAVVVPTDAAAWAMLPGSMSPEVAAYRWMLEELRVSLFAQELGTAMPVSGKRLDEAWAKVVAAQA